MQSEGKVQIVIFFFPAVTEWATVGIKMLEFKESQISVCSSCSLKQMQNVPRSYAYFPESYISVLVLFFFSYVSNFFLKNKNV